MFTPSRQDARQFFFDTWRKHKAGDPLTDLERLTLSILIEHPEYHPIVDNPDRYGEREWQPEDGDTNPFLHMGLHLAIEEQLSIDQPFSIRELHDTLARRHDDRHAAQHEMMECLAEMIWHAQRNGGMPDVNLYLSCIRGRLGIGPEDTPRLNPDEID
ncbi:DUF1841 family protein [Crenobacter cavernae]|uniref:DUF1841 family protein n=1 Tax=Crenobacter cavernae TaxID=2290923 RepID=A0A345Y364_9NEIS|nr:DUF1841 family protein [Crenobacter cavernae]AXK38366.1 DUF1841 family protein [Crenobacter cavernae]